MNNLPRFERLLAKSYSGSPVPDHATLPGHLRYTHACALVVLDCTGEAQLRALGLDVETYLPRLRRIVEVAAAIHDLGKANDHFQGMIHRRRNPARPQGARHEWVTYYLLTISPWKQWLCRAFDREEDFRIALWCASGHHPAYGRQSPPRKAADGGGSQMHLLLSHEDFQEAVGWICEQFQLDPPPQEAFSDQTISLLFDGPLFPHLRRQLIQDRSYWERMSPEERKLTAAAKACLIAADIAASAQAPHISPEEWKATLAKAFSTAPTGEELQQLIRDRLGSRGTSPPLRPFQQAAGQSASRVTLLKAACGTGKTIAAYYWAAKQHPGKRLYLCYPTTGTATEGFRDYLFDPEAQQSRFGAQLFHSREEVDWELLLGVRGDQDEAEQELRVASLRAWFTPIVCCTVDTVLGLLQNQRRGLYAWPALAQAAFVFDEIHAYDERLFGTLLRFLDQLRGVPVLLMTASLPQVRLQAIQQVLSRNGEQLHQIAGPKDLETLPRYRHLQCAPQVVETRVRQELARGGKVLWICNTVDRALAVTGRLEDCNPLVYHSRFRYCDRVARHKEMIGAFKPERPEPALAVCTQVAEMSLDISATLLVTELAPVPALIQRLGRLNRFAGPNQPPRPFMVVEPLDEQGNFSATPYGQDSQQHGPWPQQAREWLRRLDPGPLSQRDLAEAWEETTEEKPPRPLFSLWLDGGPSTQVDSVRDTTPGLVVLLEQDAEPVQHNPKELVKRALPMPRPPNSFPWKEWDRLRGVRVVPEKYIHYDTQRGAQWRKEG